MKWRGHTIYQPDLGLQRLLTWQACHCCWQHPAKREIARFDFSGG